MALFFNPDWFDARLAERGLSREILAAAWHAGARFGLLRHETDTQAVAAVGRALHQETRR